MIANQDRSNVQRILIDDNKTTSHLYPHFSEYWQQPMSNLDRNISNNEWPTIEPARDRESAYLHQLRAYILILSQVSDFQHNTLKSAYIANIAESE